MPKKIYLGPMITDREDFWLPREKEEWAQARAYGAERPPPDAPEGVQRKWYALEYKREHLKRKAEASDGTS